MSATSNIGQSESGCVPIASHQVGVRIPEGVVAGVAVVEADGTAELLSGHVATDAL
jgi:hypothetical protein